MCVALAALSAIVRVTGQNGERTIPFAEFHRLPGDTPQIDTNLLSDEIITAVDLPAIGFAKNYTYLKLRDRTSYAFALVSVAAALEMDGRVSLTRQQMFTFGHRPTTVQKLALGAAANGTLEAVMHEAIAETSQFEDKERKRRQLVGSVLYHCENAKLTHKVAQLDLSTPIDIAIRSAFMLGAGRLIAIDRVPERLQMAKDGKAEVLNYEEVEVGEALKEMTGGRGPDSVMDAVGMEAHGLGLEGFYDKVKQTARLETDRPNVLRQAIVACRKGGTVSVPGVYTGFVDKIPMGAFMNKGLTMKTGQTHVHRYLRPLLDRVQNGDIDPSFVITHRLPLELAPHGYEIFNSLAGQLYQDCAQTLS